MSFKTEIFQIRKKIKQIAQNNFHYFHIVYRETPFGMVKVDRFSLINGEKTKINYSPAPRIGEKIIVIKPKNNILKLNGDSENGSKD